MLDKISSIFRKKNIASDFLFIIQFSISQKCALGGSLLSLTPIRTKPLVSVFRKSSFLPFAFFSVLPPTRHQTWTRWAQPASSATWMPAQTWWALASTLPWRPRCSHKCSPYKTKCNLCSPRCRLCNSSSNNSKELVPATRQAWVTSKEEDTAALAACSRAPTSALGRPAWASWEE